MRTRFKLFTRFSQGNLKALKDPKAQRQNEEGVVLDTASSKSISHGEGDYKPTPSDDLRRAADTKKEF
jgi:hypothetical protein